MRSAVIALAFAAACGGSSPPAKAPPPPRDTRTPIEKRRDAACEALQPKLLDCALADTKAERDAGKLTAQQYDKDVADLRRGHRATFMKDCTGAQMSSRQVRVLEVCFREEHDCGPLADCLANLAPAK